MRLKKKTSDEKKDLPKNEAVSSSFSVLKIESDKKKEIQFKQKEEILKNKKFELLINIATEKTIIFNEK